MSPIRHPNSPTLRPRPWWHIFLLCLLIASTYSGFGLGESLPQWVGRIEFLPAYMMYACAVIVLLNAVVFSRTNVQRWVALVRGAGDDDGTAAPRRSRWWLAAGFVFLAVTIALLERMQPLYFTRDDNTIQFLPLIVFGGRSLLSGTFPNWDPYQFLGMPAAASGIYALTYPPTYAAYILARYVLRNEFLTIDVFIIGHLVLGYFATIWAARTMKVRTSISVLAALCCVLSGYALLASRNWYYMSPVFLWVPLMAGAIWKLVTRPQLRWVAFLGFAGGMFFHAGNAQMWSYSLLLFGLACIILWLGGTVRFHHVVMVISGFLLAIAVAAPLMLVQVYMTGDVFRPARVTLGRILLSKAVAFLIPGTWLGMRWVLDWSGNHSQYGSAIVYSGTLFLLAAFVTVLTVVPYRCARRDLAKNVWIACALAAFLFGLGFQLPFWPLLLKLPGFASFRLPFKFIGLVNIFAALGGAIVVERLLRRTRNAGRWEAALFASVLVLLGFHCSFAKSSYYQYGITFSDPASPVRSFLQPVSGEPVRFLPIFPLRNKTWEFERVYPLDIASLYGLYSVSGNDGLADWVPPFRKVVKELDDQPEMALAQLGVNYALLLRSTENPPLTLAQPEARPLEMAINVGPNVIEAVRRTGTVIYSDHDVILFKLSHALPLAFPTNDPARSLPISFSPAGSRVETGRIGEGGNLTVNVICRRGFAAYADGREIPWSCDQWQRLQINVPPNTRAVELKFQPPWGTGFLMGAGLALIALGVAALTGRFLRPPVPAPPPSCEAQHCDPEQILMVQ